MNRAWKTGMAVGIVALVATTAAGCSSSSSTSGNSQSPSSTAPSMATTTYAANGVTFQYPDDWAQKEQSGGKNTGNLVWTQSFGPEASKSNLATVSEYTVNLDVTSENVAALKSQIETTIADLASQAGGSVTTPVSVESTAGFPGYTAKVAVKTPDGTAVDSTLWMFFNGKTEYFLNCQAVPEAVQEMAAGCDVVRQTFKTTS